MRILKSLHSLLLFSALKILVSFLRIPLKALLLLTCIKSDIFDKNDKSLSLICIKNFFIMLTNAGRHRYSANFCATHFAQQRSLD